MMNEITGLVQAIGAGFGITLLMTISAFIVGTVISVPVALLKTSWNPVLRLAGTSYIEILRGIPTPVWLMIIYYEISPILQLDLLPAAIIGLSLIAGAYLVENLRAGLENVAFGQREARLSLGLSGGHLFWRVIAPQAVKLATPPSASYLVGLLKESAIASVIGVTDIIFMAKLEITRGASALLAFSLASVLYLVLSIPISWTARRVDTVMRRKAVAA